MAGRAQPKTGRRKKGTSNKATAEIKEIARQHGPQMIEILVNMANIADSDSAKIAACKEVLDRGFGKPRQSAELSGNANNPLVMQIAEAREAVHAKMEAAIEAANRKNEEG